MNTQTSLMITTDEFGFTNAEVGFIRKNFQRKYPAIMGDFIDCARELMKQLQLKSKVKLVYKAYRYYPDGQPRYHISESLGGSDPQNLRSYVGIQPVEPSKKAIYGVDKGKDNDELVQALIQDFDDFIHTDVNKHKQQTFNGLQMVFVVERLRDFLEAVKDQITIQNDTSIQLGQTSSIVLDIGHKGSRSHYLVICFDFTTK